MCSVHSICYPVPFSLSLSSELTKPITESIRADRVHFFLLFSFSPSLSISLPFPFRWLLAYIFVHFLLLLFQKVFSTLLLLFTVCFCMYLYYLFLTGLGDCWGSMPPPHNPYESCIRELGSHLLQVKKKKYTLYI